MRVVAPCGVWKILIIQYFPTSGLKKCFENIVPMLRSDIEKSFPPIRVCDL